MSVKKHFSLAAALVTLLTGLARTAQGDVVASGYRFVRHDAVFENVNDDTEYVFFVLRRDITRDQFGARDGVPSWRPPRNDSHVSPAK